MTHVPETGALSCFDSDRDSYLPSTCGGPDCDDLDPYINPGMIDGAWSLQTRFVGSAESVRWFSLDEAGNAHWITQVTHQTEGDDALGLRYAAADGLSFGAPQMIDDSYGTVTGTALWTREDGPHVLYWNEQPRTLQYASDANQWSQQLVSGEATGMSRLVLLDGRWHTTFTVDYSVPLLRHAISHPEVEGYWEISELGEGTADGLFLRQDNELQMITSSAGSCFRHGRWLAETWDFSDYGMGETCEVLAVTQDSADRLHVLFRQASNVQLATEQGGAWTAIEVSTQQPLLTNDSGPLSVSFMVDEAGALHIAVAEQPDSLSPPIEGWPLFYVSNEGGSWHEEVVAWQTGAMLVAGPDGAPVIGLSRHTLDFMAPQLAIARRTGNDGIDQNCNGLDGT